MPSLGDRIREARESKGLLQAELASQINVKSSAVISNWEKGINKPDADKLVRLCEALDVSPAYMLDYFGPNFTAAPSEQDIILKYRQLDTYGKALIDMVLHLETIRVEQQHAGQLPPEKGSVRLVPSDLITHLIDEYEKNSDRQELPAGDIDQTQI